MNKKKVGDSSENLPLVPRKRKKKKWMIGLLMLILCIGLAIFFKEPILRRLSTMPGIGKWFAVSEDEEEELSIEELKEKVRSQEQEVEALKAEVKVLETANEGLNNKNESLKQYEAMYTEFMAQKEAWDESVAQTNPELFMSQFESMYPDTAERIYRTLRSDKVLSDEQKALSKTIGNMDEDQAAKALERLIGTDSELIQSIFGGMSIDQKALILSAMTSESAAQVIKLISPDEEVSG